MVVHCKKWKEKQDKDGCKKSVRDAKRQTQG